MKNSKTHVPNSIEFFIYNSNIPKFDEVLIKVTVINKHSYENDLNIEGTIKIGIYQDNLLKYIFIKKSPNDKIHPKKFI